MILGLILSQIPPFIRNKFRIFTVLRNMWLVRRFCIFWKGRPWQVALHRSFTTLIWLSMSGTCPFTTSRFTSGPPGRDTIRILKVPNFPSARHVVMRKPWCRWYWYKSLKYLNISGTMKFDRWFTSMKCIFRLNVMNNGILFTKKMSHMRKNSLCKFINPTGIFNWSLSSTFRFIWLVLPLSAVIFLPHTFCVTSTPWTVTGKFLIWLMWITHL